MTVPLPPLAPTIGACLRAAARDHGERFYILAEDARFTFAAFDRRVDRLAAGLMRLGVSRGDHVALWLPNDADWVLTFCACARIGAPIVPVNTRYKAEEAAYVIRQSDARAIIMTHRMWGTDYVEMLEDMAPGIAGQPGDAISTAAFPELRAVVVASPDPPPGLIGLDALMAEGDVAAVRAVEAEVRPEDLLLICYTSGTTGHPKGVMHNHHVIRQSTRVGVAMHVEAGDRVLAHMPFYHAAGLFMALIPALTLGAALVPLVHWNAAHALDLIERERVTMFGGIPTHFYDMVQDPHLPERDTSSLKAAWIGGSAVMQETFETIMRQLKLGKLLSTYGMTENTISTSFNRWDDPVSICCRNAAPMLSDCELRIVDPETLRDRPPGEPGEIWVRGETVMMGYYKDPEGTAAAVTPDGWLRTGDIGAMGADGYLHLTARLKEMLKVGGTNTSPIEIEQHLAAHPAILSSVVVGAPDERLGEVAYAYVQARPGVGLTADEVMAFCRRRLASYKVPRYVTFLDEFPRTATGKIQRHVLARMARDEVGRPDDGSAVA